LGCRFIPYTTRCRSWRRGWQPADVVRIVRRELDDTRVRLVSALIRAQAPHDRARGPRWKAQLAELTDEPAPRADRFSHATAVLRSEEHTSELQSREN